MGQVVEAHGIGHFGNVHPRVAEQAGGRADADMFHEIHGREAGHGFDFPIHRGFGQPDFGGQAVQVKLAVLQVAFHGFDQFVKKGLVAILVGEG